MSDQTRVVYDCNTLIQALASSKGAAGQCVHLAFERKLLMFLSPFVLAEFKDVASRVRVVRQLRLTPERVVLFLNAVSSVATLIENVPAQFAYERDPDDAHYVNLALAANATLIVTRDTDLLDLMKKDGGEGPAFQARFPALRILTPVELLHMLAIPPLP